MEITINLNKMAYIVFDFQEDAISAKNTLEKQIIQQQKQLYLRVDPKLFRGDYTLA